VSAATKPLAPSPGAPVKRGRWGWIIFASVAVAGSLAAGWYYHTMGASAATGSTEGPRNGAPGGNESVPVQTVRLANGGIVRTSSAIGSVQPWNEADLYAKVSGYLSVLKVDYGDHVKRGQLLAEIDDPEVVADAEKAAADVQQSTAAVAQAEAFIESATADREASASAVEQMVAEVERYVAMRSYHGKKLARYQDLVRKKATTQQIADEEEESYESAKASEAASRQAVLHAKAQLVAAAAKVKKAKADLAEAHANVKVADAKLARAKVLVGYTRITSPYDGVITKRNFFRGAFIRSAAEGGTIPLLTVAETDKVRVITYVPDRDVPLTDVGDRAEVTLDALGSEILKGKVSRFAETEDPTSRTMYTEIDLPNPGDRIRAGMYGIAKIMLETETRSSTLPASCVVGESNGGKADLYVVKDGKAKKTRVEVGADDGIRVEILSGITSQDEVIMNTGSVSEGTPVRSSRGDESSAATASGNPPAAHQVKSE
jgi:HlyD family secretion protein